MTVDRRDKTNHGSKEKKDDVPRSKPKKPTVRNTRPEGFKDMEDTVKDLLNAKGINYFEWLHELHKEEVNNIVAENREVIAQAVFNKE